MNPANKLSDAASPYLLQHADNPVNWHPWGEEAFAAARREDKPVFLSIGYSACHWCHVMARESFEDPEVAALLNEAFVCVKVDREERPDIDSFYMTVCQLLTGSGGWPLTILMTADKRPCAYVLRDLPSDEGLFTQLRRDDGTLLHRRHRGRSGVPCNADDYAFLIWGLIELYESGFDTCHLRRALDLQERMVEQLWDPEGGGFFFAPAADNDVPVRLKESHDGALPCGNSVAVLNLLRLAHMTGDPQCERPTCDVGEMLALLPS